MVQWSVESGDICRRFSGAALPAGWGVGVEVGDSGQPRAEWSRTALSFQAGKTLHLWPCLVASWELPNVSPEYELDAGIWLLLFLIHVKRKMCE